MQFAVIADIHGNHLALEAVLADIDRLGIADIINLGDSFSGPLDAAATANILRSRPMLTVRGNHDRYLIDRPFEQMGSWEQPVFEQLGNDDFAWIRALPHTAVFRDQVFACHATPKEDNVYWLESVTTDGRMALAPQGQIEAFAEGISYPLILCGHSHTARLVTLLDGRVILNPGSVGCQAYEDDDPDLPHILETGHRRACYAVVDFADGVVSASFRQIEYDFESVAQLAESRGESQWASALRAGRIKI